MLRHVLVALAVGLAPVGAVACGDDSDSQTAAPAQTAAPTQTAASPAVCAGVADLQDAAGALRALDPANTTATQLRTALTDLQSAAVGLASAASTASSADVAALTSALDGLTSAAQNLDSGQSPQQTLAAVSAALVPVEEAATALGPDCAAAAGGTTTG